MSAKWLSRKVILGFVLGALGPCGSVNDKTVKVSIASLETVSLTYNQSVSCWDLFLFEFL